MALNLYDMLADWSSLGLYDVLLPFLLIFTIVFAFLQKSQILGDNAKNFNAIISLILGLLVIRNERIVFFILGFLPNISLFFIIILMFLLLLGIFSGSHTAWIGASRGIAMVVSMLFVLWALFAEYFGQEVFDLPFWFYYSIDPQTKSTIVFIGLFVILLMWITGGEKRGQHGQSQGSSFLEKLGNIGQGQGGTP